MIVIFLSRSIGSVPLIERKSVMSNRASSMCDYHLSFSKDFPGSKRLMVAKSRRASVAFRVCLNSRFLTGPSVRFGMTRV